MLALSLREEYQCPSQPLFSYAFLPSGPPTSASESSHHTCTCLLLYLTCFYLFSSFFFNSFFLIEYIANAIMGLSTLLNVEADLIYLIRQDRMQHLASKVFGTQQQPSQQQQRQQQERLAAQVYSSLTLPFRCKMDGEETDMRKFITSIKPFPRLSFLSVSHLPFINECKNSFNERDSESSVVVKRLLKGGNSLSHDPSEDYHSIALSGYSLFRCKITPPKSSTIRLMKDSLSSLTEVVGTQEDTHTHTADNTTNKIPPRLRVLPGVPNCIRHRFSPILPPPLLSEDPHHNNLINKNIICGATLTRNSDAFIPYMHAKLKHFDQGRRSVCFGTSEEEVDSALADVWDILGEYQRVCRPGAEELPT